MPLSNILKGKGTLAHVQMSTSYIHVVKRNLAGTRHVTIVPTSDVNHAFFVKLDYTAIAVIIKS